MDALLNSYMQSGSTYKYIAEQTFLFFFRFFIVIVYFDAFMPGQAL